MVKNADSTGKTFGCLGCGQKYEAYPPDDDHRTASLTPCKEGDSIAMTVKCSYCQHSNTLHWDVEHFYIASV